MNEILQDNTTNSNMPFRAKVNNSTNYREFKENLDMYATLIPVILETKLMIRGSMIVILSYLDRLLCRNPTVIRNKCGAIRPMKTKRKKTRLLTINMSSL